MFFKKLGRGITFLLLAIFLFSCSSSRKTTKETSDENKPKYDESFDPLKLNDEDINFKEEEKTSEKDGNTETKNPGELSEKENQLVDGFRVQLFATKDIESATVAKKEAEFAFVEDGYNVYVEFDSPYYKVRIGDFTDREKATAFREIAREKGYPSPWVVKTKVWSNPSSAQEQEEIQN